MNTKYISLSGVAVQDEIYLEFAQKEVNCLFILYWKEIQKAQPNLFSGRFSFDLTFSVCILGNGL